MIRRRRRRRRHSPLPSYLYHSRSVFLIFLICIHVCCIHVAVTLAASTTGTSSSPQPEESPVRHSNHDDDDDDSNGGGSNTAPSHQKQENIDQLDDGVFDAISPDPDCQIDAEGNADNDCWQPPASTLDEEESTTATNTSSSSSSSSSESSSLMCTNDDVLSDVADGITSIVTSNSETSKDNKSNNQQQQQHQQQPVCRKVDEPPKTATIIKTDKHWGSDPTILKMRDKLRGTTTTTNTTSSIHPPIFLLPGLASTRLVAWRYKSCPASLSPLLPVVHDIKVQDVVWLNLQLLLRTPMDMDCMKRCLQLGPLHQDDVFCKLRPDEGLDAISSLAPGGLGSHLLVGGTNTVYAWLIQWLADHLGYDVTTLIGLPYDWRLSPHKMQQRDGFLTWMRRHIETAVQVQQGQPGIMVAHSMGNLIFRYFLEWLRQELRQEAHQQIVAQRARNEQKRKRQRRRIQLRKRTHEAAQRQQQQEQQGESGQQTQPSLMLGGNPLLHVDDAEEEEEGDEYVQDEKFTMDQSGNQSSSPWLGGWMSSTGSSSAPVDASITTQQETLPWTRKTSSSQRDDSGTTTVNSDAQSASERKQHSGGRSARQRNHRQSDNEDLLELADIQGDELWYKWIEQHIWTYVGLSAPMLGAVNPLRAVISGENMGLPISDEVARVMELTFGSTNTVIPLSSKMGFCDDWSPQQWDEEPANPKISSPASDDESAPSPFSNGNTVDPKLACLDDIMTDIELHETPRVDPWKDFPTLKALLKDRADWDSDFPMIEIENCGSTNAGRSTNTTESNDPKCRTRLGARDAQLGDMFAEFSKIWKEEREPLMIKREQLLDSFQRNTKVPNILNSTWERPLIKHVIMAYGVDIPTEVGYVYKKKPKDASSKSKYDGVPTVQKVIWEEPFGRLTEERVERERGGGLTEVLIRKKSKRLPLNSGDGNGISQHSGDGTIPYLSLSWAHTWLLHAVRAMRYGNYDSENLRNPLENIEVSHRPKGAMEWKSGPPPVNNRTDPKMLKREPDSDTGTLHPHGTKYKPEMVRYHTVGKSRTTGIEYSTTVIEAIGVEHKETTRNYDVLAACFTDVLKYMHNDFGLV